MNRDSKHNTPQNTISLNARPLSPLLSLPPSSHSGQKIEDTHQALTAPNACCCSPSPSVRHTFNSWLSAGPSTRPGTGR